MKSKRSAPQAAQSEPVVSEHEAPELEANEAGGSEPGPVQPAGYVYSPEDKRTDLMDRLVARHMPSGKDALKPGEIIKRREVSFDLDGVECEPDMFVDENGDYITFRITLRSLGSAQEIEAMRGVKDGTEAPLRMCKLALYAINGKPIAADRLDFFWEALGSGGRQICFAAFQSLGAASEASMGKYLTSRSEG